MRLAAILLVTASAVAIYNLAGVADYEDAMVRDAMRKDPPPIPYTLPTTHPLSMPSDCDMTVEQNGKPPRCYFLRGDHNRGASALKTNGNLQQP